MSVEGGSVSARLRRKPATAGSGCTRLVEDLGVDGRRDGLLRDARADAEVVLDVLDEARRRGLRDEVEEDRRERVDVLRLPRLPVVRSVEAFAADGVLFGFIADVL